MHVFATELPYFTRNYEIVDKFFLSLSITRTNILQRLFLRRIFAKINNNCHLFHYFRQAINQTLSQKFQP